MVGHGNRGKRAGKRKVMKSGAICLKLVDGSVCRNLPAESAEMPGNHVIVPTDDVNSGAEGAVSAVALSASQIRSQSLASVPAPKKMVKTYLTVNNDVMTVMQNGNEPNDCWYVSKVSVNGASTECQRFWFDLLGNQRVASSHKSKDE